MCGKIISDNGRDAALRRPRAVQARNGRFSERWIRILARDVPPLNAAVTAQRAIPTLVCESLSKLSAHDGHRMSRQFDALAFDPYLYHAAPGGSLIGREFTLVQPGLPERSKTTMCRTRDRIFVNTRGRCKEARDEI